MRLGLTIGALMVAMPAQAQVREPWLGVLNTVKAIAFDPGGFFERPDANLVGIRYTGDDYGWPVYSIAVRSGCRSADEPRPACYNQRIARMVRAPIGEHGAERARWRGSDLINRIVEAGATSEGAIKDQLDKVGVEWLEAELQTCSGAIEMLTRAEQARWGPYTPPPNPNGPIIVSMHADQMEVDFRVRDGRVDWRGTMHAGTAGRWADDFAKLIEPCWHPASVPTPWRRVAEQD